MARSVVRTKLTVNKSANVSHLPSKNELVVKMDNGKDICIEWMHDIDNAYLIANELNLFLAGKRAKRGIANICLKYLKYVSEENLSVDVQSLKKYREKLDESKKTKLNTKAQSFGAACRFVKHLMLSKVISYDDVPDNFGYEERETKNSFVDICRNQLPVILKNNSNDIIKIQEQYDLDKHEAMALFYCNLCMDKLQEFAEDNIRKIFEDWEMVDEIISQLDKDTIIENQKVKVYRGKDRTIPQAISILFSKFGRALPASTLWPVGVVDFCKSKGWIPSRIRGAFFPTLKTLDSFLVLALANHRLMPNVDSVAFYTYTNCCKPAFETGHTEIYMGKFRGEPVTEILANKNYLIVSFQRLSRRVETLLPAMPNGHEILKQEFIPIMLHYTASAGREINVKAVDASSPSYMVRRFIKKAAKKYPELAYLENKATGENFRPTHAYIRKLSGESIYKIKNALNHKNISTTEGYVSGIETKAIQNKKHQDFQRYLISESTQGGLRRTGSGYICDATLAEDPDCIRFNNCIQCNAKRIVFEDIEITAEWIAWKDAIIKNKTYLQINNPTRWVSFWEPKLVEFQSLIALSKQNTLRKALKIANELTLPPLD